MPNRQAHRAKILGNLATAVSALVFLYKKSVATQGAGPPPSMRLPFHWIRDTLLTRWKREAQSPGAIAFGGPGTPRDEELARLKRELARVTDITEIKTQQGKLYLCIVLDLYDQRIVSWSMHARQDRQMVIRAVQMAVWQRQGSDVVILHSDRCSQFRSGDYQGYLAANGLICSMSAVGHCGDNAACEGFFGLLKRERIYRTSYPTLDAARADVFDYIERRHNPRMRRRIARQDQKVATLLEPSVISG